MKKAGPALILLVLLTPIAPHAQVVFKTGIDVVTFGVIVLDKRGSFVADLTDKDFDVYEDGKKQTLRYFARGDDDRSAPELHVGLLLDTSGSMTEDIKLARSAAIRFLNTLTSAVDITLVDFDTEVRFARYGQADFPRLVERIRTRKPVGWTALYDAIGVYLDAAANQNGRKVMVVYTDGGDTRSSSSFGDTMTLLKASDATVYAIGFLEHQSSTTKTEQRMILQQVAEITGGLAYFPNTIKELDPVYDKILAEIRAQCSLGYLSTNERADGAWRKVEIKVNRPDLKDLKIRTRKGYFAPYKESPARSQLGDRF